MKYLKFSIYLRNIEYKFKKKRKINKKFFSFKKENYGNFPSKPELYTFNQLLKFNDILKAIEKE